jgi:SAM-dependent methyltransferase
VDFAGLATKYVGPTAAHYEQNRVGSKWRAEEEAAEDLLREVESGSRALDIPVGTGRLLPHLEARRFEAHGLDVSPDMLAIARTRADVTGAKVELGIGDIRNIPFNDGYFDLVTCVRFLNLIDAEGVEQAVNELARVTSDKLLLGIRYLPPLNELKQDRLPAIRLGMRAIGVPRLHAHLNGLFYHRKSFVDGLFERIGLEVIEARYIERRIDGTDYVFFLLRKIRSSALDESNYAALASRGECPSGSRAAANRPFASGQPPPLHSAA